MSFAARQVTTTTVVPPSVQLPTTQSVSALGGGGQLTFFSPYGYDTYSYTTGVNFPGGPSYTYATPYTWLLSGNPTDYEVRFTLTSGSISGTTGSWINIGYALPGWSGNTATGTLEIRNASTFAVLATCTVNFYTV